ncbi:MAG: MinD/ParA family ATP-binding protein, partial [Pirellulales bacterium]
RDTHARLAQACRRFLAIDIPCVAKMMSSAEVSAAARRQAPFAIHAPVCQATQTIEHLAQFFAIEECLVDSGYTSEKTIQVLPSGQPILRPGVGQLSAGKL